MPGENFLDWSTTAANNGTADSSINWAEGMARAAVNDSARSMMAALAKYRNLSNGSITTGGSANTQTFTSGVGYLSVPTGLIVKLKLGFTNTGSATLNMDGIGGVTIKTPLGAALVGGELVASAYAEFVYDGTNWILLFGSSAAPTPPQITVYTSGSGTYTTPTGCVWIQVEMVGGGGGGGGGSGGGTGGNGGNTTFSTLTANGGTGSSTAGGAGGTASGGDINLSGATGSNNGNIADSNTVAAGATGASSPFGGAGTGNYNAAGGNAVANTGSGGGGGGTSTTGTAQGGAGGGAGGYLRKLITSPSATYSYAVGAAGTAGTAGGNGYAGGTGGSGLIIATAHFGT